MTPPSRRHLLAGSLGTFLLSATACTRGEKGDNQSGFRFGAGGGGAIDKSGDAALQTLIAGTLPRFRQARWTDPVTQKTYAYNIFVPDGPRRPLPMVTFIADASTVGSDRAVPLRQGLGGLIWASPATQAATPAIVLVPQFAGVAIDDHGAFTASDDVAATARLVRAVAQASGADPARRYATGQSMGCMMFLLLAATDPTLLAGEFFVSGQCDITKLDGLAPQRFVYSASAGDAKASGGQAELRALLTRKGIAFASTRIDWPLAAGTIGRRRRRDARARTINFITFESGSVLPAGVTSGGGAGDHMSSFDPAYRLAPVRAWLLAG